MINHLKLCDIEENFFPQFFFEKGFDVGTTLFRQLFFEETSDFTYKPTNQPTNK